MSTVNETIVNNDTFLQHVLLKNYRSIKDVEIDFKPGLNIIIGKNASGKTNFINGLKAILDFDYNKLSDSEAKTNFWFKTKKIEVNALNATPFTEELIKTNSNLFFNHKVFLRIDDFSDEINDPSILKDVLFQRDCFFYGILTKYGVHYQDASHFVNVPFSFVVINNGKISNDLMSIVYENNQTEFVQIFFSRLRVDITKLYRSNANRVLVEDLKKGIISSSEQHFDAINDTISLYSPIKAIRLNPDFNVIKEDLSQKQTITNFYLEFLIDENWLTYSLLSDGTKRLFYIISEILSIYNDKDDRIFERNLNVFLIEEPELGIHPHQLHKLMQFIKEQSRQKQIIITTHSPQVLDVIEPDELDRIIICHSDPKNGTQLNHLSDKQVNKAKKYMKEDFLSDYWRFSDLEPA